VEKLDGRTMYARSSQLDRRGPRSGRSKQDESALTAVLLPFHQIERALRGTFHKASIALPPRRPLRTGYNWGTAQTAPTTSAAASATTASDTSPRWSSIPSFCADISSELPADLTPGRSNRPPRSSSDAPYADRLEQSPLDPRTQPSLQ